MAPPLPPPAWGPADVLGPQAPVVPILDRPPGLVGDLGGGTLDLSLPSDDALFAGATPDPRRQYALIRDARPTRLAETAARLGRAGAGMDTSATRSQAALGQLGSAFTNNGGGVYDAGTHWGALPPDYRDAGAGLGNVARRLTLVADALTGAQTSSVDTLNTLVAGLAATRARWSGEVDAARGPDGLIPYDRIGALLTRRTQLSSRMQADTDTAGRIVTTQVEDYENALRGLLTVLTDTGHVAMTLDAPVTGLQITPPAPTGPWAQIFPLGDGLPTLEGGYTPLPGLPPPLINVPAPLGPSATDQGQAGGLLPGLTSGGTWYDRNSSPDEDVEAPEPAPELTPAEKEARDARLRGLEAEQPERFGALSKDPDHNGKVTRGSSDEARVALDMWTQGRLPADIERPGDPGKGDFYSPSEGKYYDLKGLHSDWPPTSNPRDPSAPFENAYGPSNKQDFIDNIAKQVRESRTPVIDTRNASQSAIDDLRATLGERGLDGRVIWYP